MPTTTANWWQYSRWVWIIARSLRLNTPSVAELAVMKTYIKVFWDADLRTGTRPWLETAFNKQSVAGTDGYKGDVDVDSTPAIVEMLEHVGRDLKRIPLTDDEKTATDVLIAATGSRRYGDKANLI